MFNRTKLFLIGLVLGLFTTVIGAGVFDWVYFKDKKKADKFDVATPIVGGVIGTAITLAVLFLTVWS